MNRRAAGDRYTVYLASSGSVSIAPFLAKKRPYDPVQDFTPVTLVAIAPLIVTMHPSLPVKSVKQLIGLAKAKPKQLLFASPGTGTAMHLTIEMFSRAAGITMVHVPYKGGPPAVIDTMSGQVQLVITTVPPILPHVRASRLRALAVTSSKRSSVVPEVPTVAESGQHGFESLHWWAMFAPKNTPAAITEKLFGEVRKAVENPPDAPTFGAIRFRYCDLQGLNPASKRCCTGSDIVNCCLIVIFPVKTTACHPRFPTRDCSPRPSKVSSFSACAAPAKAPGRGHCFRKRRASTC